MNSIRCENKYYQLEELEDSENCITEIFLLSDGSVVAGKTDGPQWEEAIGRWEMQEGTNEFQMDIIRKYASGTAHSDMGEFDYEVDRTFIGEITTVGDSVSVSGVMVHFPSGQAGPDVRQVGFFSMIDSTAVRAGKRSEARVGVVVESPPFS